MDKPKISSVIMDIDNTLFDWFDMWYFAFSAMLSSIVTISGFSEKKLKDSIKSIHQKYGTSEYPLVIQEIPDIKKKYKLRDIKIIFAESISKYKHTRDKYLRLYPSVYNTLLDLKSIGCKLICYSESHEFYSKIRIKKFGLDGVIDFLYSPPDTKLPVDRKQIRSKNDSHYEFEKTICRNTPEGELKPNVNILKSIIKENNLIKNQIIYIGDSLMKDIYMAQGAKIIDVYAKYGSSKDSRYELLKEVTHWTKEDVEREQKIMSQDIDIKPNYTLDSRFDEIYNYFEFINFNNSGWVGGQKEI